MKRLLLLPLCLIFGTSSFAQQFYWDGGDATAAGNNAATGAGLGGPGTWDTITAAWWDGTNDVLWPNTAAAQAIFTGAYPVTGIPVSNAVALSGAITANKLTFVRSGYTLSGGTLNLDGTTPTVEVLLGESVAINSQITGTNGLTKTGYGTLHLRNSSNSYTGTTTINNGVVGITNEAQLGTDTSTIVVNGTSTRGTGGGALVLEGSYGSSINMTRDISLQGLGPIGVAGVALVSVGNNTLSGTLTTNVGLVTTGIFSAGGMLTINDWNVLGTTATTFTNVGYTNSAVSNYRVVGALTGSGSIQKLGAGTLDLTGVNASGFTGTIRMVAGNVRIDGAGDWGANAGTGTGGPIDFNGDNATLEIRGDTPAIGKNVYQRGISPIMFVDHAIGSSAQNVNATFLNLQFDDGETFTFNGRNGGSATFTTATVQTGDGNSTFANNLNGTLTFTGNFWNNANTAAARSFTLSGNGNTVINGSIIAAGGATFDHTLTKSGSGNLMITGVASTLDGAITISAGSLTITDFRSITQNTQALNLGATTTSVTLNIGTSVAATSTGLVSNKVINLAGTTGGATINANQTGANPVVLNGAINSSGAGLKTLTLGGTNTADNVINGIIGENSTTNRTNVTKTDDGTWVLAGPNTYTGSTTILQGTLKIKANAAASNVIGATATNLINLGLASNVQNSGGVLEFVGVSGSASTEALGSLVVVTGASTVRVSTGGGGASASLNFSSLGTVSNGTGVNFVTTGGGAGATITLTGAGNTAAGIVNGHLYYNGADFAAVTAGVVGAASYTNANSTIVGTTNTTPYLITGSFAQAANATARGGIKFSTAQTVTLNNNIVLTINNAATSAAGGILVSGTNGAVINGGTGTGGITSGGTADIAFRINGAGDQLDLQTGILATTTGGLTKNGDGVLVLSGNNLQTGATNINEGTIRLSGTGRLSGASQTLNVRTGAILDLNGVNTGTAISTINGGGTITNSDGTAATVTFGNGNGTGTFTGTITNGAGVVNVTKIGTGAQTWSGISNYTGVTTIGGATGNVTVTTLADIGAGSGIGAGDSASTATNAASLVFNGTSTTQVQGGITYTGTTSVSTNRLFTFDGGADGGARILNNSGNQSSLVFSNSNALAFGAGATGFDQDLILGGTSTGDNYFNPQINDNGGARTFVFKNDASTWFLGNANNTYSGLTTINAGTLATAAGTALSVNTTLVFNGTTTGVYMGSGIFQNSITATPTAGTGGQVSWAGNGGFAAYDAKLVVAIGGVGSPTNLTWASGGFTSGTLILNSTTALNEVEFRNNIDLAGAVRTIQVDENTTATTDYATISGNISGGAGSGITKTGNGILQLMGDNTYSGKTTVNVGLLVVDSLGNSTGAPVGTSVGTSVGANLDANSLNLGNGTTVGGSLQYVGAGEISDRFIRLNTTTATNVIHADGGGALILTNLVNDIAGAKTLNLRGSNTMGNMITSVISSTTGGTDLLTITADGAATWILTGNNTYVGTTNITSGTLGAGSNTAFGNSTVVLRNGNLFAYGEDRTLANAFLVTSTTSAGTSTFFGDYSITMMGDWTYNNNTSGIGHVWTNTVAAGKTVTSLGDHNLNALAGAITYTFNGTGHTIISGDIQTTTAHNIAVTYNGTGKLTLGGVNNDFNNGNMTVSSGTLQNGASEVLSNVGGLFANTGDLIINPAVGLTATYDLNGFTETVNGFTAITAGTIVVDNTSASAASFIFGDNNAAVTMGGGGGSYTITNSGGGRLSITKIGTNTATIGTGVTLTYTGATTVNGGTMNIASALNGTNALNVGVNSTLSLTGGLTSPALIQTVSVANGGTLGLLDGSGNKIDQLTALTLGSSGGVLTTLNLNVGDLLTSGDELNTDLLNLLAGGTLNLFSGNQIRFNLTDIGLSGNETYDLVSSASGGLLSSGLSAADWILGATPGGFTSISLIKTDTRIYLQTGDVIVGSLYWNGNAALDAWNDVSNWATDKTGTIAAASVPGQGTDVYFIANNIVGGAAITTTLEQNFRINSLTFEASTTPANTPASVTINPGTLATSRLEIAPDVATKGISITAGGPATVNINTAVRLGKDQTWTVVDATSTLSLGSLQGEADVVKAGAGKVILTSAADLTFNNGLTSDFTINAGALEIQNAGSLGTVASNNLARVAVNSTGAFYFNNATSGIVANAITLNGGALSAGGNTQTYSGNIAITADSFINMRENNSAVLSTTSRSITLTGVLSGIGDLTIDSINTVSGGSQIGGTLIMTQNNAGWTGDTNLLRGTVDVRSEFGFGTGGDLNVQFGRVLMKGTSGQTWTQFAAGGITLNNPGANAIVELQADNQTTTSMFTVDLQGQIDLGSATSTPYLRLYLADALSAIEVSGNVILNTNSHINTGGAAANTGTILIDGLISDGGSGYSLTINDNTLWAHTNYQTTRLAGANTFSGDFILRNGTLEFSTVSNIGGPASNLGQGSAITLGGATLRFIGGVSQATNRTITTIGSPTLSANGTGGASITYNGAITQALDNTLNLTGTGDGIITGGITQLGTSADLNVTGGNWLIHTGNVTLADDLQPSGGTLTLQNMVMTVNDDIVVSGPGTILNLNSTGVWNTTPASTSNYLYIRNGAVVNINANDVNGANNANLIEGLLVGESTVGAVATLNMNNFTITTPRLDLGGRVPGVEGLILGSGTINVTADFNLYRGAIYANLAGAGPMEKYGSGTVTLYGNNSGLTSTTAALISEGNLVLDYTLSNTNKLNPLAGLDLRGGTLTVNGSNTAATVQTVALTTLAGDGASTIDVNAGTGQTAVLNLGAITRAASDGTLLIFLPGGTQNATNGVTTTTANGTHGLWGLSGFAIVQDGTGGGLKFATNSGGNVVGLTSTAKNVTSTWAAGDHVTDQTTGYTGTITSKNIASLRFDAATGSNLDIASTGVLSVASGGILVTDNVTTSSARITGGTLATGVAEFIVHQFSSQIFEIGSEIRINNAVTKAGTGTLLLSGTRNNYTGQTQIQEGVIQVSGGNAIGDASLVTIGAANQSGLDLLNDETIGRLSGGNATVDGEYGVVSVNARKLTMNQSGSTTYAGIFTGTGTLVRNGTGNLQLTGASSAFTGDIIVNGGILYLTGATAQINASSITVNKGGGFIFDQNGTSPLTTRILDTTPIYLNSADGMFSSTTDFTVRGLALRTDQDSSNTETVGAIVSNSGANYITITGTTTSDDPILTGDTLQRFNNSTVNIRGTNLGTSTSTQRGYVKVATANEAALIGTLVGGGGAAGTQAISILTWGIGESFTGDVGEGNMGNSFLTYAATTGFRALTFSEYDTYTSAAANENVRENLGVSLTGLTGKTINSLVVNNNNVAGLQIMGTGLGSQTLVNTSGAFLFTLTGATALSQYGTELGGFDGGIAVGGTEYVIHVVDPNADATANSPLTATISSALTSTADITKSGRGTLVLTASNAAGGNTRKTTINEGTLEISDLDNIGGDTGGLVFAGGTLRLSSTVPYTGDDFSTRTISFLNGGGTIDTNGVVLALAGSVGSGTGGLTKVGLGSLTLNAAATYTGATVISGGAIILGANNALGTGDLTINGGAVLDITTRSITVATLNTAGASPFLLGSGTITSNGGFNFANTGDTTVDASLAGTGSLLKTQTNVLTLTGDSTFTGVVEVYSGTLAFDTVTNVNGGASALGNQANAQDAMIRMGLTTTATTLNYIGLGASTSNRLVAMQGTTGGVTVDADGGGALTLGGVRMITPGNKTLTLTGTSGPSVVNTMGSIQDNGLGVLTVAKTGGNVWMINQVSTYSGATNIDDGTLMVGVTDALPTGTAVRLGTGTTSATLDLNGFDQTIGSLTSSTNSAISTNFIIVDSGNTLTINGAVTIGANAAASTTQLTAMGGGNIVVNSGGANFQVGGATGSTNANTVNLDFSGLSSFTANLGAGTFRMGDNNSSTPNDPTTFVMAVDNSITAAAIRIGDGSGAGVQHTMILGSGTNTLNADIINVGSAVATIRSGGAIVFAGSDTTGTVSMRASNGTDRTILNMINTTGNTGSDMVSTLNFGGHTADLLISTLTMATRSAGAGAATATLTFDQGTLDVTTWNMANKSGTGTGAATATVDIGDSAAAGTPTVTIGTLTMASNTATTAGSGTVTADFNVTGGNVTIGTGSGTAINMANTVTSRSATSTFDLTGGNVTVNGNIIRSGGNGAENASITLDGATLDMTNHSIGTSAATITLNARSGVLRSLAELNGGGTLTKVTSGVLVMEGVNAYTGATQVAGGTLQISNGTSGSLTGGGTVTVAGGTTTLVGAAMLSGGAGSNANVGTVGHVQGNTVIGSGAASVGILAAGIGDVTASNDTMTFGGTLSVNNGSQVQFTLTNRTTTLNATDMATLQNALGGGGYTGVADLFLLGELNAYDVAPANVGDHDYYDVAGIFSINSDSAANASFLITNNSLSGYTNNAPQVGDVFNLIDWANLSGMTFTGANNTLTAADFDLSTLTWAGDYHFDTSAFASHGILVVVPEPSRALLVFVGLLGFLMRRKR